MGLSLQRKLELAGDLAKVQPLLQRLHLMEKPKQRHRLRNAILVGALIGAVAAVVVAMSSRRCRTDEAAVGNEGDAGVGSAAEETLSGTFN
jgi:hypothetical protein